MQIKRAYIIGAAAMFLMVIAVFRSSFEGIAVLLVLFAVSVLPTLLVLAGIGALGYVAYRHLTAKKGAPVLSNSGMQRASPQGTRELTDGLAVAFRRNNARQLHHALGKLPPWPISEHIGGWQRFVHSAAIEHNVQ